MNVVSINTRLYCAQRLKAYMVQSKNVTDCSIHFYMYIYKRKLFYIKINFCHCRTKTRFYNMFAKEGI
jgi:hypothetical protein